MQKKNAEIRKEITNMTTEQNYVISVSDGKQKRLYFGFDEFDYLHSTGMPCWTSVISHAKYFDTVESAKKCFEKNKKYLKVPTDADITTLSVGHINIAEDTKLDFD